MDYVCIYQGFNACSGESGFEMADVGVGEESHDNEEDVAGGHVVG